MAKPRDNVRVLWNFGDGQFSNERSPQHVFRAPGTYDITLSVTRVSDGLIRTRTIENLVTIHANPEAEFTWEVPESSYATPGHHAECSKNAASCTWVVDGESPSRRELRPLIWTGRGACCAARGQFATRLPICDVPCD